MANTSPRQPRWQTLGITTEERNKLNAIAPIGNEAYINMLNIPRSEDIAFQNVENFTQDEVDYINNAHTTYTEAEVLLKGLETKKARMSYTVTFNANTYTFTAKSATISELITGSGINQTLQDKTVGLSPTSLFNGFHTTFIAPATNTGSATISVQLYDTTFTSKTLKKYQNGVLVNLTAGDIVEKRLYYISIISGEAVLFSNVVLPATNTTQGTVFIPKPVIITYVSGTSISYSSGNFAFDDGTGQASISAGTLSLASLTANASWYVFAIYNPTTNVSSVAHYNSITPTLPSGFTKKRLIFAFTTNATSQVRPFTMYADGYIEYVTPIIETTLTINIGTNVNALYSLTVPSGINHQAKVHSYATDKKAIFIGSASQNITITSVEQANHAYGESPDFAFAFTSTQAHYVRTNTNSQVWISTIDLQQAIAMQLKLITHGYTIISY